MTEPNVKKKPGAKKAAPAKPAAGEAEPTNASTEAAAEEAQKISEPRTVVFRGVEFKVSPKAGRSARFLMGMARNDYALQLTELLGTGEQQAMFIALLEPGEEMLTVYVEFADALNTVMKLGDADPNSPASAHG